MDKLLFSEEQKFDQLWVRVVFLMTWVPLAGIFGTGIYRQVVLGKPWGNHPTSDLALVLVTSAIFLVMTGVTWLIFSLRLIIEVTEEGLHYRFPPVIARFRTILANDIADYMVREYDPVREYGGWGIRTGGFGKGSAYNVKGKTGLQLTLRNGKKILFGTQRPDALLSAMDRLMKSTRI